MKLPSGAHVAVIDGERFVLLRNTGDAVHPNLGEGHEPTLNATNKSQGKMRHSITTSQHRGDDLDEAAHVSAAAEWLNHAVLTNKIDDLVIVADARSLGELRRHYHKELEARLIGEVDKALTNRPVKEVEEAILAA